MGAGAIGEGFAWFLPRFNLVVVQAGQQESRRIRRKQRVQGRDQPLAGTLIGDQGVLCRGLLPGPQISVQVGMAKTVDGLLGVADQEQRPVGRAVYAMEDVELQGIGILEFVDQRRRKTGFEGGC